MIKQKDSKVTELEAAIRAVGADSDGFVWILGAYHPVCPFCFQSRDNGHLPDCIRLKYSKETSMNVTMHRCDNCGNETEDHYARIGWIEIKIEQLSVSLGRDEKRQARTIFSQRETLDFCCVNCLVEYIQKRFSPKSETVTYEESWP